MKYEEAVTLAKKGDDTGFQFLYESTYKEKYYIAIKYMKNETAAQDVLQDAYIRAFSNIEMLRVPESFPGWMGQIVANTAKNALQKKQPILFSEMNMDSENDTLWEEQIEDEKIEYRPEEAYSKQEIQELVHKMIESLSDEQRFCILMFYMEEQSIRDIAMALECSENTVKSRLNYGRKALRLKAEELQKKGYKLYSVAPLPLLLYLLRTQQWDFIQSVNLAGTTAALDKIRMVVKPEHIVQEGVKQAFLHTVAGKITAGVVGIALTGAVATGVIQYQNQLEDKAKQASTENNVVVEQTTKPEEEKDQEKDQEKTKEPETEKIQAPKSVKEEEYASLIAGNLTKSELELVLAYGPQVTPPQGYQDSEYRMILNTLCQGSDRNGNIIEKYGVDANWKSLYSAADVNRLFSSFTSYQFTEENNVNMEFGINVEGDSIIFSPATAHTAKAVITSAEYTDTQMNVYFTYGFASGDGRTKYTVDRKAILEPTENKLYQIVKIEEIGEPTDTMESEFPVGIYAYTSSAGGQRSSMTIDPSGMVTMTHRYSYNDQQDTYTYQMLVDHSVTPVEGMTVYMLQDVNGGESRSMIYKMNEDVFADVGVTGSEWVHIQ